MRLAILCLVAAAAALLCRTLLPGPGGTALAWGALLLVPALLARGILSVRSSLVEPTAWRNEDPLDSRVGLSFDDGPHPEWTPRVLDALREGGARATFFLVGENVRRHPGIARRIVAEGHEVACHADSHSPWTPFRSGKRMAGEIRACLDAVRADAGVTPRLYRPPFGLRSPAHHGVVRGLDMVLVGMARRGLDKTAGMTREALVARTVERARPGEVLALHDGDEPGRSTGRCLTADALPEILRGLRARGLEPVPVAALLSERPYAETPKRTWTGRTRGGRIGHAIFVHSIRFLGLTVATLMVPFPAAWFTIVGGEGRRASIAFRRRLHGKGNPLVEWFWVFRHFNTYGKTLLWRVHYLLKGGDPPEVTSHGYERILPTIEAPGPVLLVSAHQGDWMGMARRLQSQKRRRLWVVAFRGVGLGPHQIREAGGEARFHLIDVEAPPGSVALSMAAALEAGDAVALHADRLMAEGDGVRVPFLGADASFPRGVWNVAMVTGAPTIVYFAMATGPSSVELRCYGPIRVPKVPPAEREAAVTAAAREFAGYLEDCVRRHPLHWGNFHDFWKA